LLPRDVSRALGEEATGTLESSSSTAAGGIVEFNARALRLCRRVEWRRRPFRSSWILLPGRTANSVQVISDPSAAASPVATLGVSAARIHPIDRRQPRVALRPGRSRPSRPLEMKGRLSRSERSNAMFFSSLYVLPFILVVAFLVITASVRILREYERAVVFTLGRFQKVKGPGLVLLIPFIQEMVRVDLRIQVIEIPSQDVISRDNVSMKVDAVLYFSVVNSERAIIKVQNYLPATNMLAQTTLRSVLGQHDLDEMLSERKKLSTDVQSILDAQTETWGIKVSNVEIRTVELTENMVRAIAKQAEAERDRRAKIIHAEAEFQASQTLVNAAQILSSIPAAMQLRYLQTLTEIGAEQNSTIVFPMPIDIIKPFLELFDKAGKPVRVNGATRMPHIEDSVVAAPAANA
jgi:regulator of protease activity HflC (stomatin/prohibitin superfamily)